MDRFVHGQRAIKKPATGGGDGLNTASQELNGFIVADGPHLGYPLLLAESLKGWWGGTLMRDFPPFKRSDLPTFNSPHSGEFKCWIIWY